MKIGHSKYPVLLRAAGIATGLAATAVGAVLATKGPVATGTTTGGSHSSAEPAALRQASDPAACRQLGKPILTSITADVDWVPRRVIELPLSGRRNPPELTDAYLAAYPVIGDRNHALPQHGVAWELGGPAQGPTDDGVDLFVNANYEPGNRVADISHITSIGTLNAYGEQEVVTGIALCARVAFTVTPGHTITNVHALPLPPGDKVQVSKEPAADFAATQPPEGIGTPVDYPSQSIN